MPEELGRGIMRLSREEWERCESRIVDLVPQRAPHLTNRVVVVVEGGCVTEIAVDDAHGLDVIVVDLDDPDRGAVSYGTCPVHELQDGARAALGEGRASCQ